MSLYEILETIFIGPLKLIFEYIFYFAYKIVDHPGLAIIVLFRFGRRVELRRYDHRTFRGASFRSQPGDRNVQERQHGLFCSQ